jgi:hypothetical protein
MSNKHGEKYKEEEARLIKELKDAETRSEQYSILMKYEREYVRPYKILKSHRIQLRKEMEEIRNEVTKNNLDKYYRILMKYEEELLKLEKEQDDQYMNVHRLIYGNDLYLDKYLKN